MNRNPAIELSRNAAERAIHKTLAQFKIQIGHPEACLQEAAQRADHPGFDDKTLEQWQEQAFVTIDNPDSRDLDQALLIERTENESYRVRYALADAAFYVPPGSALFNEALKRGVTYYTPLLAAPMLPISLSEDLVSLNPEKLRRALVFDINLSDDASVLSVSVVRALIISKAKLSYASVQAFLDADAKKQPHEYHNKSWATSLKLLRELGEKLIQQALDRDVIPFNRSEAQIELCDTGLKLSRRTRVRTEKYNEQISLLCNMQGAEILTGLSQDNDDLQAIFRAHDAPLARRLSGLRTLLSEFVDSAGLSDQWRWHKDQSLADYVTALPDSDEHRGKVLAIERQILVCNQASEYRSEPGRHHALAASSYARFSSPMREIVGIFTHKELLEAMKCTVSAYEVNTAELQNDHTLRKNIIDIANLSRQTQKQINKRIEYIALCSALGSDLETTSPPARDGIIMGFKKDRIYVAVESIATDLKVSASDLEEYSGTRYEFSSLAAVPDNENAPSWLLGDSVKVSTLGFDSEKNRFKLGLTHS